MTRRERLEHKLQKRREWAEGRARKAEGLRNATPESLRGDRATRGARLRRRQAEEAGGVAVRRHEEINWCVVTFAEKPERAILDGLRAAGYGWGGGSWQGYLDRLPASVEALEAAS
jgi:hypothetical protein